MNPSTPITHSATLEDVANAMALPDSFRIRIRDRSERPHSEPRTMTVVRVSIAANDRHIVVGRWPDRANPELIRDADIATLSIIFA